jgi:pyruvate/2-oxoglutarate dehydrogenase complex dihydrolipoamide acyltransferase (E2) component
MGDPNTAPAEACAPDPDRAGPDSPDLMPEWLAYLIALVIVFLLEQFLVARQRDTRRTAARRVGRTGLPRDSAAAPAAASRSRSGHATARTRRGHAAAPEGSDLSRMRAALLEKLRQSDVDPAVLSQLEALGIAPGPIGPDAAATPAAPVPSPLYVANIRHAPRRLAPAGARHGVSSAPWRRISARRGTGPPTGPPALSRCQSCYA